MLWCVNINMTFGHPTCLAYHSYVCACFYILQLNLWHKKHRLLKSDVLDSWNNISLITLSTLNHVSSSFQYSHNSWQVPNGLWKRDSYNRVGQERNLAATKWATVGLHYRSSVLSGCVWLDVDVYKRCTYHGSITAHYNCRMAGPLNFNRKRIILLGPLNFKDPYTLGPLEKICLGLQHWTLYTSDVNGIQLEWQT